MLLLLACAAAPDTVSARLALPGDLDVDDDGWTLDAGDCDDHDPAVRPGTFSFATWSPRYQELPLDAVAGAPLVADLDADGLADLAVPYGGRVHLFRSVDGRLTASGVLDLDASRLAAADLDADGAVDLVAQAGADLHLLRGDGGLRFTLDDGPIAHGCVAPVALAAEPGAAHLVCADPAYVIARVRAGHLHPETVGIDGRASVAAFGDWDADGDLDTLVSGGGSRVATSIVNLGDDAPQTIELTAWLGVVTLTAGDFDADGDDDVIFGHDGENDLTMLTSDGVGGWSTEFLATDDDYWDNGYKDPDALGAADLDGDGLVDLVALQAAESWVRWGGAVEVDSDKRVGTYGRDTQAFGDVDGDGLDDLIIAADDRIEVHRSRGDGDFDSAAVLHEYADQPWAGDLDGDGIGDIVGLDDGALRVWLRAEEESWSTEGVTTYTVGDVDGDALPDLVTGYDDVLTLFRGDGDGTFGAPERFFDGAAGRGPEALRMADFDEDGDLDLVAHRDAGLTIFRADAGQLVELSTLTWPDDVVDFALGTLDDDGVPDLVVVTEQKLLTLRGRGDGTFDPRDRTWVDGSPRRVVLGDMDRDTIDEIFVPNGLRVLAFDAALTELAGLDVDADDLVSVDLSGDGRADLLVDDDDVSIYLSDGASFVPGGALPTRIDAYGTAVGDLEGDGDVDVLVRSNEQLQVFENTCR